MSFYIAKVQKVLTMLDLTDLQDVRSDALSGGQKRKLSLGIAILGNPQVGTGHIYTYTTRTVLACSFVFCLGTQTFVLFPRHSKSVDLLIHSAAGKIKEPRSIRTTF